MSSGVREEVRTFSLARERFSQRFAPSPQDGLSGCLLATTRRDTDQGGCSEEFVPTNHNVRQLQVVQQYLSHTHEHFRPFHTPVVAPYGHLNSNSAFSITSSIGRCWL